MHFCNKCNNMYYLKVGGEQQTEGADKLIYYCRNCGNEDDTITVDNVSISKINFKKGEQNFNNIINEYTKLDPTLPRINNIPCPNTECISNTDKVNNDIVYLRYDEINMKYVYLCAHCDTVWRLDQEM